MAHEGATLRAVTLNFAIAMVQEQLLQIVAEPVQEVGCSSLLTVIGNNHTAYIVIIFGGDSPGETLCFNCCLVSSALWCIRVSSTVMKRSKNLTELHLNNGKNSFKVVIKLCCGQYWENRQPPFSNPIGHSKSKPFSPVIGFWFTRSRPFSISDRAQCPRFFNCFAWRNLSWTSRNLDFTCAYAITTKFTKSLLYHWNCWCRDVIVYVNLIFGQLTDGCRQDQYITVLSTHPHMN